MSIDFSTYKFRRLHPLTMIYGFITSLPGLLFSLYLASKNPGETIYILLVAITGLLAMPSVFLRWFFFQFQINPSAVNIYSGIISKQQRSIPIEKIQNIEIRQNFLQRLLRIAHVSIETASGSRESEGNLQFVSIEDAELIRTIIRSYKQQDTLEIVEDKTVLPIFSMSVRNVLISGMMQFSPILFIIATSISQYWQAITENNIIEQFTSHIKTLDGKFLLTALVGIFAGALLLSWIGGILLNFSRFYGFTLTLRDNKLFKEHGLFARWKGTIPLKKIQMMTLSANPLMRVFAFARLEIQTAGFGTDKSSSEIAVPMANFGSAAKLAQNGFQFELPDIFNPLSPYAVSRAAVHYAIICILLTISCGYFISSWAYFAIIALLPISWLGSILRYKWRGYALDSYGNIILRSGWINNRISIIPTKKIQSMSVRSTFLQRRLRLATLIIDTATNTSLRDTSISDISANDADNILNEITLLLYNRKIN